MMPDVDEDTSCVKREDTKRIQYHQNHTLSVGQFFTEYSLQQHNSSSLKSAVVSKKRSTDTSSHCSISHICIYISHIFNHNTYIFMLHVYIHISHTYLTVLHAKRFKAPF